MFKRIKKYYKLVQVDIRACTQATSLTEDTFLRYEDKEIPNNLKVKILIHRNFYITSATTIFKS